MRPEHDWDVVALGGRGSWAASRRPISPSAPPSGSQIRLAGRSRERLDAVRGTLWPAAERWPLLVADTHDIASLDVLVRASRVVATTVGP